MGGLTNGVGQIIGSVGGGLLTNKGNRRAMRDLNAARDRAVGMLDPYMQQGTAANSQIAGLLGLGGDPAAARQALDQYMSSAGYQTQLRSGQDAVTSSAAARGMLNSGATLRGLTEVGQELGASYFDRYLSQLAGQQNVGLNAASNAGGIITGTGTQNAQLRQDIGASNAGMLTGVIGGVSDIFGRRGTSMGNRRQGN